LANQAEKESTLQLTSTSIATQKLISDLSMIKIKESRKRLRPKDLEQPNSSAVGAFKQLNSSQ